MGGAHLGIRCRPAINGVRLIVFGGLYKRRRLAEYLEKKRRVCDLGDKYPTSAQRQLPQKIQQQLNPYFKQPIPPALSSRLFVMWKWRSK
jgi:hypothetical protein